MDCSRFDRVVAPIMLASPDLHMVYANPIALRQFPFLSSSAGLRSRYDEEELQTVSRSLKGGQPCFLQYDESLRLSLLLNPEFGPGGDLLLVCVYVVSENADPQSVFPLLADGELIHFMQRQVADPMGFILKQLRIVEDYAEKGNTETLLKSIKIIRLRILQMTLFFGRMSDCSTKRSDFCVISDAVAALLFCQEAFPFLKYKPSDTCYISMERESLVLMFTDVLSNLCFRQDKPSVSVSTSSGPDGVTVKFVSGPLNTPINVPCNEDYDGIDIGMYSVCRRAELANGQVSVKTRAHGGVTVTLKFEPVNLLLAGGSVEDPSGPASERESFALEYLSLIAEQFQGRLD